ncbi:sugar transferase [Arenibacter sp. GZD96]|uniref:sugar transferase n=1 Tax=Aurantibrevibacter litoralis TaxID=3106030 RepID=UPI002AFF3100|nr:sugar transferase [Arenibacter sp. GZD-96]MEA1787681.1 sugar transferase [Arenibacter sp. GZD-96]
MYPQVLKRVFDIFVTLFLLLLASPIFLVVLLLLYIANSGKPFFFQPRPGKNELIFKIIKFKSMNDKKDKDGHLLPDFQRMTGIGRFIRNTSLDELPQLLNVLQGDMSLVGPRPLLVSYLPLYSAEQKKRHLVKPGITGWAQVNGRNAISWEQKFALDVHYVTHCSFALDVKILWLTFLKVVKRDGISAAETLTMEPFKGNPQP